jgi:hypothetical protein
VKRERTLQSLGGVLGLVAPDWAWVIYYEKKMAKTELEEVCLHSMLVI